MSVADKLRTMETLWNDLSSTPKNLDSPDWHLPDLDATQARVDSGPEQSIEWNEAKKRPRSDHR